METGLYQNQIPSLDTLTDRFYENIFKLYKDGPYHFYNILQQVTLPDNIDTAMYEVVDMPPQMPFTVLSHKVYGNINLWWLICLANDIANPTQLLPPGTQIRVIKPHFVGDILTSIQSQLS